MLVVHVEAAVLLAVAELYGIAGKGFVGGKGDGAGAAGVGGEQGKIEAEGHWAGVAQAENGGGRYAGNAGAYYALGGYIALGNLGGGAAAAAEDVIVVLGLVDILPTELAFGG